MNMQQLGIARLEKKSGRVQTLKCVGRFWNWPAANMRLSHPMRILTILIGALVLNMFDAANCRADESATEAMLRTERLGGLRLGLPEKDVLKLLGPPAKRGELVFQEADGNYVQDWHYPEKGIELLMSAGEKKSGKNDRQYYRVRAVHLCDEEGHQDRGHGERRAQGLRRAC